MSEEHDKNQKKGPKLFRPGEIPSDKESDSDKQPNKPRLFKPGASQPISGSQPIVSQPEKPNVPSKPKLFKPGSSQPGNMPQSVVPQPVTQQNPTQFQPQKPKLFKSQSTEQQVPLSPQPSVPKPVSIPQRPPEQQPISIPQRPPEQQPISIPQQPPVQQPISIPKPPTPSKKQKKNKKKTISAADLMATMDATPSTLDVPSPTSLPQSLPSEVPMPTQGLPKRVAPPKLDKSSRSEGNFIREQLFAKVDVRKMFYKSILAGFLASISMILIAYLVYCFDSDSFFNRTIIFSAYSQGNVFNEMVSLWTVAYTPISAFSGLNPDWLSSFAIHLSPLIFASLVIGIEVKNIKYCLLSVLFFVMFSIIIPLSFLVLFPIFGLIDPSSVDAGLVSAFPSVVQNWSAILTFISEGTNSVFFAWSFGGAIELGLLSIVFIIPFSLIFSILKLVFSKNK